jgi:hypothetical protein
MANKFYAKLITCLFIYLLSSCVTASNEYIQADGNYIDSGFTHTVSVIKINVLNEFGITQKEWNACFERAEIYKAFSSGNAYASRSEVEHRAFEAIKIVASNNNLKFYALISKNTDVSQSIGSYTTYKNSNIYGNNGYIATVSTPSTQYYDINKYSFSCYVMYFDDENEIDTIRNIFGAVNIFENF